LRKAGGIHGRTVPQIVAQESLVTSSSSAQSGTPGWFKREKLWLIETAKAVDSFSAAARNFQKLVELGATADAEVRSALHTAGVINYARPFSNNLSGEGGQRTRFAKKNVKDHPSFDDEIHDQLMLLRHKLIAHSDGDYADDCLFLKRLDVRTGQEQLKILVGATVLTLTVHMLEDMEVAKRYLAHVEATAEAAYTSLAQRLEAYVRTGWQFPDALEAASKQNPRIIAGERFELSPAQPEATAPLGLLNPHAVLNPPKLEIGRAGYAYRSFSTQVDLPTNAEWGNSDGSKGYFRWAVVPGEAGPEVEDS
jgi:hypothetical protein